MPWTWSTKRLSLCDLQRTAHVREDVLCRFTPHAEADDPLADGVPAPAGAAFRHRMDPAEAGRFTDERQRPQERLRARARVEIEADDGAEGLHLALRDGMAGMVGQARIGNGADVGP